MTKNRTLRMCGTARLLLRLATLALCAHALPALAIAADEGEPLLRLEAGGSAGYVTALAFSPNAQTLYVGSWDKTVRVWHWNAKSGEFRLDPIAWRIPIGPGLDGAINAIAVSPDGNWLAAAGRPVIRGSADFRNAGRVLPTQGGMTDEMRQDEGTIYLFDTRTRVTRTLRGHRGEVRSLIFAPSESGRPVLISGAREWNERTGKFAGSIRLWDAVAAEPYVTGRMLPEPRHETWPKLAARRTGAGLKGLEVAAAWGDGVFRVWNVATDTVTESAGQGQYQDTVVLNERDGQFISGGVAESGATRVRSWNYVPGRGLAMDAARSVELARTRDAIAAPRALAMASANAGDKSTLLVSIVHRHYLRESEKDHYELWAANTPVRGTEIRPLRLWDAGPAPRRLPVIAAVPGGQHLAVSNGMQINVYDIADLLAGRGRPQVLRSAGSSIANLAFLNKEGTPWALGLSERAGTTPGEPAAMRPGDLVFDFEKSNLSDFSSEAGWKVASPPLGAWRVAVQQPPAGDRSASQRLQLTQNGENRGAIDLPAGHVLTNYALAANRQPPVLALATHHNGLPALNLYNAASGELVRQLSAHAGLIRSLAFSADGQLLGSAADDQTVCIWRLADLDKIIGVRGLAPGIAVRQAADGLVVEVDEALAPAAALQDGDVLVGRVIGDQLRSWATARDFYDTFWNATPGAKVQVRRSRAGSVATAVIEVAQGADERKPLLSFFITEAPTATNRGWIGWSPLGPYQASSVDVEHHLGWHFNTGRPQSPVSFAGADQYREKYHRKGLLDSLLKTGLPPKDLDEPAKIERPDLDLIVDGKDPQPLVGGFERLVRYPPTRASLVVAKSAAALADRVELQVDDQPAILLERLAAGNTWSIPLDLAAWKPGEHVLKATLYTRGAAPQAFVEDRRLRYQLPAPQVIWKAPLPAAAGAQDVEQAKYTFAASVIPSAPGEMVEVVLRRRSGKEAVVIREWRTRETLEINETVTLEEGGNVIELEARNPNALKGFDSFEVTRRQRTVNLNKQIQLAIVNSKLLIDDRPLPTTGVEGTPQIVTVDKIRLSGELKEEGGAFAVGSSQGGLLADITTTPSVAGKLAKFTTGEISIKPGVQTVQVTRKVAGSPPVETGVVIDFRPPLPTLVIESPKEDLVLVEGRDSRTLKLAARLSAPVRTYPFEVEVWVNNKPLKVRPTIDLAAGTVTAEVPLALGENQVALKVSNEWNPSQIQPVATVDYLTLPTVTKFGPLATPQAPLVDVIVFGKSALPITQVESAGIKSHQDAIRYDRATGEWQATLRDVALQSEAAELAVEVWNDHGKSLAPGVLKLPAWRQPAPPPIVELTRGANVTHAEYQVHFTVRSKSRLHSVNLQHDRVPTFYASGLAELKPALDGWYTFEGTVPVALNPGSNRLEVLAANESGSQFDQTIVNYIAPPARIVIDRLETADLPSAEKLNVTFKDGRVQTDRASPTGKVMVHGHIEWSKTADEALVRKLQQVQVWVNGFQQSPLVLSSPDNNLTGTFSAFVILNQERDNQIQFSLPDLTVDTSTVLDVFVNCEKPIREQRLHLLVISVGAAKGSEAEIEKQVLTAMKAKPAGREFRTSAFNRVAIYGPLVGPDITPQQVRYQLSQIKVNIENLYRANRTSVLPANDVIMIYLEGGQLVHLDEDFFVTIRPLIDLRTARALREKDSRMLMEVAVKSRSLADLLSDTTGAHLLFLDVAGSPESDAAARWPEKSRAAMLRYTWLKNSAVPPQAKLLTALPEAIEASGKLQEIGEQIEDIHLRLAGEFPESIGYNRRVPEVLESLLLGEPSTKRLQTP